MFKNSEVISKDIYRNTRKKGRRRTFAKKKKKWARTF